MAHYGGAILTFIFLMVITLGILVLLIWGTIQLVVAIWKGPVSISEQDTDTSDPEYSTPEVRKSRLSSLFTQQKINSCVNPEIPKEKKPSVFGEYSQHIYKKDYLMTKREAYFYRELLKYLQDKDYIVCPKVRLEDIIGVRSRFGFRPWKVSGRLDRSHIDFVLIGKTDLRTKLAIEVDDYSHDSIFGKERDKVKDEACHIAGVPLVRFRETNEIQKIFLRYGI